MSAQMGISWTSQEALFTVSVVISFVNAENHTSGILGFTGIGRTNVGIRFLALNAHFVIIEQNKGRISILTSKPRTRIATFMPWIWHGPKFSIFSCTYEHFGT